MPRVGSPHDVYLSLTGESENEYATTAIADILSGDDFGSTGSLGGTAGLPFGSCKGCDTVIAGACSGGSTGSLSDVTGGTAVAGIVSGADFESTGSLGGTAELPLGSCKGRDTVTAGACSGGSTGSLSDVTGGNAVTDIVSGVVFGSTGSPGGTAELPFGSCKGRDTVTTGACSGGSTGSLSDVIGGTAVADTVSGADFGSTGSLGGIAELPFVSCKGRNTVTAGACSEGSTGSLSDVTGGTAAADIVSGADFGSTGSLGGMAELPFVSCKGRDAVTAGACSGGSTGSLSDVTGGTAVADIVSGADFGSTSSLGGTAELPFGSCKGRVTAGACSGGSTGSLSDVTGGNTVADIVSGVDFWEYRQPWWHGKAVLWILQRTRHCHSGGVFRRYRRPVWCYRRDLMIQHKRYGWPLCNSRGAPIILQMRF